MDSGLNGEEPTSWEELYNINLIPSELFLKFRKEIEGIRVGVNLEELFFVSCRIRNRYLASRQAAVSNERTVDFVSVYRLSHLVEIQNLEKPLLTHSLELVFCLAGSVWKLWRTKGICNYFMASARDVADKINRNNGCYTIPQKLYLFHRQLGHPSMLSQRDSFYNAPVNEFQGKLVLKPLSLERRWKFIYEPIHQDVRVLSKKIPLTKFLYLQVGMGHNFQLHATVWKWKLTTCFGGYGISRIRNKTSLGLCPGVDFRFGWRAGYILPEDTGALGTGEPLFNLSTGRLQASLDRVEAIITYLS